MKAKTNFKNVCAYIVGTLRYELYYSKFKWLIRKHIREQIEFRINSMLPDCYNRGSCVLCGCKTTALQMANKSCDNPCYPIMLKKEDWEDWKVMNTRYIKNDGKDYLWKLDCIKNKFIKYE